MGETQSILLKSEKKDKGFLHSTLIQYSLGLFGGGGRERVSLCSPGCPETHSEDQAGLKLRNLPASERQAFSFPILVITVNPARRRCTWKR